MTGSANRALGLLLGFLIAVLPAAGLVWWWTSPAALSDGTTRSAELTSAPAGAMLEQAPARLPEPRAAAAAGSAAAAADSETVRIRVSFAGDPSDLPPGARVYVIIRASGERMPLAVERYAVAELPVTVEFAGVDQTARLEAVARLSMSGNVTRDPGDLEVVRPLAKAGPRAPIPLVLAPAPG